MRRPRQVLAPLASVHMEAFGIERFGSVDGIVLRSSEWHRHQLLLVGRVDPVELAQQSRPFELGWFTTVAGGAIISGGGDLVGDRVETPARLLEGELYRAGPLHAIGSDKGCSDARADD